MPTRQPHAEPPISMRPDPPPAPPAPTAPAGEPMPNFNVIAALPGAIKKLTRTAAETLAGIKALDEETNRQIATERGHRQGLREEVRRLGVRTDEQLDKLGDRIGDSVTAITALKDRLDVYAPNLDARAKGIVETIEAQEGRINAGESRIRDLEADRRTGLPDLGAQKRLDRLEKALGLDHDRLETVETIRETLAKLETAFAGYKDPDRIRSLAVAISSSAHDIEALRALLDNHIAAVVVIKAELVTVEKAQDALDSVTDVHDDHLKDLERFTRSPGGVRDRLVKLERIRGIAPDFAAELVTANDRLDRLEEVARNEAGTQRLDDLTVAVNGLAREFTDVRELAVGANMKACNIEAARPNLEDLMDVSRKLAGRLGKVEEAVGAGP